MKIRIRQLIVGAALVGATAAGSALAASALTNSPTSTASPAADVAPNPLTTDTAPATSVDPNGVTTGSADTPQGPQTCQAPGRAAETPLTGDTATKAQAAAEAAVPGATVGRLEAESDGSSGAAYEVHMRKADGTHVVVLLNSDFSVNAIKDAPARGGDVMGGPLGPKEKKPALTGDTATKVKAAADAAVPGGTVVRLDENQKAGAAAPYEAHVIASDGSRKLVLVNADFTVKSVTSAPAGGHGRHGGRHRHGGFGPCGDAATSGASTSTGQGA
jgi:hypothetical protein